MNKEQIIREHYQKITKKGGMATLARYGKEHYKEIGKLGGRPKKNKDVSVYGEGTETTGNSDIQTLGELPSV